MYRSTPGLSLNHQLQEFTQTHAHQIGDAIQLSHPLSSPSPPDPNSSQGLHKYVGFMLELGEALGMILLIHVMKHTGRFGNSLGKGALGRDWASCESWHNS